MQKDVGSNPTRSIMKEDTHYEGRRIYVSGGYPAVTWQDHPLGRPNFPVRVHLAEWYKHYGSIPYGFVVHHKDEDKWNWHISNLELMPDKQHREYHARQRGGKPPKQVSCAGCGASFTRKASDVYGARQFCSVSCKDGNALPQKDWPSPEEVAELVALHGYSKTGRMLEASDNGVRKYLRKHGLQPRKS